jgi:hypothetical protein
MRPEACKLEAQWLAHWSVERALDQLEQRLERRGVAEPEAHWLYP